MIEIEIEGSTDALHDYSRCMFTEENCDIQYKDFHDNYLLKNLPCVVKNIGSQWKCTNKWVTKDMDAINYDYISHKYGELEAPVANCNSISFNSQCKINMKVNDYISYLKDSNERKDKLLYLKDWHLRRCRPNDNFYDVPKIFGSDWLNEYALDNQEDDFMFVYIGPKHSWTPLHSDVLSSYSWSVNVTGRKKWTFFPPGEEDKLKDKFGNLPVTFQSHLFGNNIKYFDIIQEKGDAIFVPSGWYHQVMNELDTISINHNWINACNISTVFKSLQDSLSLVEKEIEEFQNTPEFPEQCQLILKSLFGMDCSSFISFLCFIAKKRLNNSERCNSFGKYTFGNNQISFDLKNILKVMNQIYEHPTLRKCIKNDNYNFINIKNAIDDYLNKVCT